LDRAAGELKDVAGKRGVQVIATPPRGDVPAAVEPELADRLLLRLFTALAERAAPGDKLQVWTELVNGSARISVTRPAVLGAIPDSELFGGEGGDGLPGGFSLRLARGLARIAGGDLVSSRDAFALVFPRA
jgi:hypothetical protein